MPEVGDGWVAMTASSFTLTCETFHLCILTLYFYSYLFLLLGFLPLDGRRFCNRPGVVGAIAVEVVRNVQIRVLVGGVKSACVCISIRFQRRRVWLFGQGQRGLEENTLLHYCRKIDGVVGLLLWLGDCVIYPWSVDKKEEDGRSFSLYQLFASVSCMSMSFHAELACMKG